MLRNKDILIVSDVDWKGHWVCEQHIARLLSESNRVIYVEQTRTLLAFLRKAGDTTLHAKLQLIREGIRQLGKNLFVASPPLLLPFRYLPLVYQINQRIRRFWLRRLLRKLDVNLPIVITFDPDSAGIIGGLNEALSVYYRNDRHDRRGLWFNPDFYVDKRETELMRRVSLVVALSRGLSMKSRKLGVKTLVVPNAVDAESYLRALEAKGIEPTDIGKISRPRIGVVGMLDWRIDVDLLQAVAERNSSWSLVLVGPVNSFDERMFEKLRSFKNVHFLGRKEVDRLPFYARALDVGLIPYKINEYTNDILSLKLFEYSAVGVPTVATPMAELEAYSAVVSLARNAEELEKSVANHLSGNCKQASQQLVEFAKRNTWHRRVDQLSKAIQHELG